MGLPPDGGAPTCDAVRWNIGHGGKTPGPRDLVRLDARVVVRRVERRHDQPPAEVAEVADCRGGFEAVELVDRVHLVAGRPVDDEVAPVVADADVVAPVTVHVGDDRRRHDRVPGPVDEPELARPVHLAVPADHAQDAVATADRDLRDAVAGDVAERRRRSSSRHRWSRASPGPWSRRRRARRRRACRRRGGRSRRHRRPLRRGRHRRCRRSPGSSGSRRRR